MPIDFNQIPINYRVPAILTEFDSIQAQQGPILQEYKLLLIGQMIAAGSAVAKDPVRVRSVSEAKSLFGANSDLSIMFEAALANNKLNEIWCYPLEDAPTAVEAVGKITVTGTATENGTAYIYIAGRRILASITSGDDEDAIATTINTAIQAYVEKQLPVTSAVNGINANEVDITAINGGETGNEIDIRINYYTGESLPGGVTIAITDMASGANNPAMTTLESDLGDVQYNLIAFPYTDAVSRGAIIDELQRRWYPIVELEGVAIASKNDTLSNLETLGNAIDSQFFALFECYKKPTMPIEQTAEIAALITYYGSIDPARPFQTLGLANAMSPKSGDRITSSDRNSLLYNGIATTKVNSSGKVTIERSITTYQTDSAGNADTAFLDINTQLILSYIRYDWRNYLRAKYPRYKLVGDDTPVAPGSSTVSPRILKGEAVARFKLWLDQGIVENLDQFIRDVVVERNPADPNRVDMLLSPDVINQFRFGATKISFKL